MTPNTGTITKVVGTLVGTVASLGRWFARGSASVMRYASKVKTLFDRSLERPLTTRSELAGWMEANNEFEMTTIPQIRSRRLRRLCVELVGLVREVLGHAIEAWRLFGPRRRRLEYRQMIAAHQGIRVCSEIGRKVSRLNVLAFGLAA